MVLLDVHFSGQLEPLPPGDNGFDAAELLRSQLGGRPKDAALKIVLMSAFPRYRARAATARVDGFLDKESVEHMAPRLLAIHSGQALAPTVLPQPVRLELLVSAKQARLVDSSGRDTNLQLGTAPYALLWYLAEQAEHAGSNWLTRPAGQPRDDVRYFIGNREQWMKICQQLVVNAHRVKHGSISATAVNDWVSQINSTVRGHVDGKLVINTSHGRPGVRPGRVTLREIAVAISKP